MLNKKKILVTGGTGSFGKEFIKKIFKNYKPEKVIVYSRDELKQFDMQNSDDFSGNEIKEKIRFFIGDVRDLPRLKLAMEDVDIVVHTAALKQVPACEYNPFEAVKTNIIGGQNVIDASISCGVEKVIALSTDKACAPINLYGATKLASDKLFVAANNFTQGHDIKFSVVRYGNVMGSRGSVIPFFMGKIKEGVLPITDERMTRFNITLDQGVDFVLMAIAKMWGGEIFVPKIPSYKIMDIAEAICSDCKTKYIGIRPGEKLHEEMITSTDAMNTIEFKDYFVIMPSLELWDTNDFLNNHNDIPGIRCEYGFSYNSGSNNDFLSVDDLKNLIENKMKL
ncbi:MAG: UDP-N-acetylglucosamine 4,6-dehydratase (inverting) [Desulfobacula sp.]|nr:UDP-N-acetylglucosamine 4,6-dehydratase (inverting) [Desulfobacula sp.]